MASLKQCIQIQFYWTSVLCFFRRTSTYIVSSSITAVISYPFLNLYLDSILNVSNVCDLSILQQQLAYNMESKDHIETNVILTVYVALNIVVRSIPTLQRYTNWQALSGLHQQLYTLHRRQTWKKKYC